MLSWNEIRDRATKFSKEWFADEAEQAEAQTFWNEFFEVFGVSRRRVAVFEKQVEVLGERRGRIDVFWKGVLIGEHKSRGENLDRAFDQATDYFHGLVEEELPRYVLVSDFARIRLYDLEHQHMGEIIQHEFPLEELPRKIKLFGFLAGYEVRHYKEQDPVNRKAVRLVVNLYKALASGLYEKKDLSRLLVRLVFCFFADDTGIFQKDSFDFLRLTTKQDGSDFGGKLSAAFQVLDTPEVKRQKNTDDFLSSLPYVNGKMFAAEPVLPMPFFNSDMREEVLKAADFDWGKVSPAIFGSMFQFVTDADDPKKRHDIGAHYTSEQNILKVVNGLFLDEIKAELKAAGHDMHYLHVLWDKLEKITLLDPACGCGNFLVIAYRELRRIELEILKRLYKTEDNLPGPIEKLSRLSIERMYGIEIEEFPAEIARLSLYIADHLANVELGEQYGYFFRKLPLREQPHILCGNALTTDWGALVPKEKLSYILGNPPFIGSRVMSEEQKEEMHGLFPGVREVGFLDYVTAWYQKASEYIKDTEIRCAFVSTNSITQGEQVGILWEELKKYDIKIHFAHRTFKWTNEAPGKAAVYCVIIGFGNTKPGQSKLYEYEDIRGEPHEVLAKNINPYLVDGPDVFIRNQQKPLCTVPEMSFGNMPRDGGQLIFTSAEKFRLLAEEPSAEKFLRLYMGAEEFLNGGERWCLWLVDVQPSELRALPNVMRRVEAVKMFRQVSRAASTRKMAETPTLFAQRTQPKTKYVLVPRVSSERRAYIPMGFFSPNVIVSDSCMSVPSATLYHFGVLESEMHMAWMRAVCGRLESRYRYSKDIVYNNFPWPKKPTATQEKAVEMAAQAVLDARAKFPESTLADLYDPNSMPKELLDTHHTLDRAVDACYGKYSFKTEPERLEFLFGLYQQYLQRSVTSTSVVKTLRARRPKPTE